jgi:hypothetical protein
MNVSDLVAEALKMPSNTTWLTVTVEGYDQVGTTIFIVSGEWKFLAFRDPKNPVNSDDQVTFCIDGLRAVDVQKIPAA